YDDAAWAQIQVPAHWVLQGQGAFGRPIYTNVQYPFAIDPPHVPDENQTGDYTREFTIEDQRLDAGRVVLRFDGVESFFQLWVNGAPVASASGSRLVHEFDVTAVLQHGRNTVAVRVMKWSAASYLDDQYQGWLLRSFREVTLLLRPEAGIDDVSLDADWKPHSGTGTLYPELDAPAEAFPV